MMDEDKGGTIDASEMGGAFKLLNIKVCLKILDVYSVMERPLATA